MKTTEIIRVTADVYGPGAIIRPATFNWLSSWNEFHTKRIVFPVEPVVLLFKTTNNGAEVIRDLVHIRLTPVGSSFTMSTCDGLMDFLLTENRLDYVLGDNLPRMAAKAVTESPGYQQNKPFWSWLELWEIEGETATFIHDKVFLEKLR